MLVSAGVLNGCCALCAASVHYCRGCRWEAKSLRATSSTLLARTGVPCRTRARPTPSRVRAKLAVIDAVRISKRETDRLQRQARDRQEQEDSISSGVLFSADDLTKKELTSRVESPPANGLGATNMLLGMQTEQGLLGVNVVPLVDAPEGGVCRP